MAAQTTERTELEYPTHGPDGPGGESWADYFRRILHDDSAVDEEPVKRHRVTELHGEGFEQLDPAPRSAVGYQRSLTKAGFEVRVNWWTWTETGGVYGDTAKKAGEPYPDKAGATLILQAYKPGHLLKLGYEFSGGKWTCFWRQINKQYTTPSDKEVKEWIQASV